MKYPKYQDENNDIQNEYTGNNAWILCIFEDIHIENIHSKFLYINIQVMV